MVTKNNHYISKYLLDSWQIRKGMVRVFDYKKSLFEDRETETLFSKQFIFNQRQEEFFNKYIETISKQELSTIAEKNFKTNKWKNYRAIVLLVFDLIGRYAAAQNGKSQAVDFFTGMSEDKLNELTKAIESMYSVAVITVPGEGRLCFPSNALIPIFDPTLKVCHFGIPFNGNNALFILKHGYDHNYLQQISKNHTVVNLSVGNHSTDLVVVHPDCLHDECELAGKLIAQREANQQLAVRIGQLSNMIQQVEKVLGFSLVQKTQ